MPEKDQIFFINDKELALLKSAFGKNDILLYAIRNVFYQFELSEPQKNLIKMFVSPELVTTLKKFLLPTPTGEFPILNVPSLLSPLKQDLELRGVAEMKPYFEAKQMEIDYLTHCFLQLQNIDKELERPISLSALSQLQGKDAHRQFVDVTVYLFLMGFIDGKLRDIRVIANPGKEETLEETKERMKRDSTK